MLMKDRFVTEIYDSDSSNALSDALADKMSKRVVRQWNDWSTVLGVDSEVVGLSTRPAARGV